MNLHSARLYAYLFFEVPFELRAENSIGEPVSAFFDQMVNTYHLEQGEPFDVGDPDVTMLRLAEKEGLELCILRWHDIDIVEIEWNQTTPDISPFEFWKETREAFERSLPDDDTCLGTCCAYFAHSDDLTLNAAKQIVKFCGWKFLTKWLSAEIPNLGNLYRVGEHQYILLSDDKDPATFLGRDFSVMASMIRKLEIEASEFKKIKTQNRGNEKQIQKLIASTDLKNIERKFKEIKSDHTDFQDNLSLLAKMKHTFDINIYNIGEYYNLYSFANDTLFEPIFREAKRNRQQLEYDLNYAALTEQGINNRLQLLQLKIENNRLSVQRRIEVIFIAIMLGQIIIPLSDLGWKTRFFGMSAILLVALGIMWFLDKNRNK